MRPQRRDGNASTHGWYEGEVTTGERNLNGEDQEPRIVHSWSHKDYWKMQARVVLIGMLGGLALIWIGIERCVSYPYSRWPLTFLNGFIPIVGGIALIVMASFGIRRRHREKNRAHETTT